MNEAPQLRNDRIYTYFDLRDWPQEERWELVAGVAYLQAAPDRAHQEIEIISTSTAGMDKVKKLHVYQEIGVREYWIVEPDQRVIMVFKLGLDGKYNRIETYQEGRIPVDLSCIRMEIDLGAVFPK